MLQYTKTKKVFANFSQGFWRFSTKFQLFKKLCCPRAEDRAIFEDLRLQGQGLDLRGQGLQNVSSKRSSRTLPLTITITKFKNKIKSKISNLHYIRFIPFMDVASWQHPYPLQSPTGTKFNFATVADHWQLVLDLIDARIKPGLLHKIRH